VFTDGPPEVGSPNRGRSGAARAQESAGGCGCRSVARLVAVGPAVEGKAPQEDANLQLLASPATGDSFASGCGGC